MHRKSNNKIKSAATSSQGVSNFYNKSQIYEKAHYNCFDRTVYVGSLT